MNRNHFFPVHDGHESYFNVDTYDLKRRSDKLLPFVGRRESSSQVVSSSSSNQVADVDLIGSGWVWSDWQSQDMTKTMTSFTQCKGVVQDLSIMSQT